MLGVWINCKGVFIVNLDYSVEDVEVNVVEIVCVVEMVKVYFDIVKVIVVGNEVMVKWAVSYFVQLGVIFKWVNYL